MNQRTALIIGAGPAGLTAAYELLNKTDIKPIIYEMAGDIGGISKTVDYKGNKIDIGGHRFFSKSDTVMKWWQDILPIQGAPAKDDIVLNREVPLSHEPSAPDPENTDKVMLIRRRISRIFYLHKFFSYPVSININTFLNLGLIRVMRVCLSYIKIRLLPIKEEKSLEDFLINRFGKELYYTFFKDYTEKVWGVPCNNIKPEWGAQRIKGLSGMRAILHVMKRKKSFSVDQKDIETSLIERFMYPKFGPGQLWEEVARIIVQKGGAVFLKHKVIGVTAQDNKVREIIVRDENTGNTLITKGDFFFSTMPIKELILSFRDSVPQEVQQVAQGLVYRDSITVGLLTKKLRIENETNIKTIHNIIPDNWIYIQERGVKLARIQIYNNWSPYMVKDENTVWIGLEYVCNEGDELWSKSNGEFTKFAMDELEKINFIQRSDILDSIVIRMEKTYPAYFGSYDQLHIIRKFTNTFENLFLIGRNGMHRYNNMDHSMLAAMTAVDNIINKVLSKDNIWSINLEGEYHEEQHRAAPVRK